MNYWKKLKHFRHYKKLLKQNKGLLLQNYNMKIDDVYRCYTVVNFPPEDQENVRQYGYYYIDNKMREYIKNVQEFFAALGLFEMIGVSELKQLDDYNVLLIIEFKHLNSKKIRLFKRLLLATLSVAAIVLGIVLL